MGEQPGMGRARMWLGAQLPVVLRALATTVVFLGVLWVFQLINSVTHYSLNNHLDLVARQPGSLPKIFTVELVHAGLWHIEGNSIGLAVLAFLVALRGATRFLGVTLFIIGVGGALYWLFGPANVGTVGASGLIFGYFGYLLLVGLVERNIVMMLVAAAVGVLAYLFYNGDLGTIVELLTPNRVTNAAHISWQGHLCGLVAGIFATGLFVDGDPQKAVAAEQRDAVGPKRRSSPSAGASSRPTASGGISDEELDRLLKDL